MRRTIVLLALLAACRFPQSSSARPAVGVTTALLLDSARHGADLAAPRPVQLTVWYPGFATSAAPPLAYGDYFDLAAAERGEASDAARHAARADLAAAPVGRRGRERGRGAGGRHRLRPARRWPMTRWSSC